MDLQRKSGILMPLASLPGAYGIGSLGKPAFDFIDFLKKAQQRVWQLLPLAQTGFGDSPYQSCSAFAGNPYWIDLDLLHKDGLLTKLELRSAVCNTQDVIDYAALYRTRYALLRKAFTRFSAWYPDAYYAFCHAQNSWLEDYALYMTAKGLYNNQSYLAWPEAVRLHQQSAIDTLYEEHENEVHFWKFCQFVFAQQWQAVKAYATQNGIALMGDLPIYISADSADAWAGKELFLLQEDGLPTAVAGCPPDYFAKDGQLWGNPLYRWDYHASTNYAWWVRRIQASFAQFDLVRIDHFRAFDTYYSIPYGEKTAKNGVWKNGPGIKFFKAIETQLGTVDIVAEDLGELFDSVRELLKASGFPGMKVLQFAFGGTGDNEYLPHHYPQNCVVYPGTHDNTTLADWLKTAPRTERKKADAYFGLNEAEGRVQGMLRGVMSSPGALCVVPMADWLCLDATGRINTPATLGGTNWVWRCRAAQLNSTLAKHIAAQTVLYGRA